MILSKIFTKQDARAIGLNFLRVVLGRRNMRKFFKNQERADHRKWHSIFGVEDLERVLRDEV